jgi:hypothetical protein
MTQFIKEVFDPTGNGNCGYCCISKALEYEDRWFQVRKKMLKEAKENRRVYSKLQGAGKAGMTSMIASVEVKSKVTKIVRASPPRTLKWVPIRILQPQTKKHPRTAVPT